MPVLLQPAYILHRRPFRETSLIVEFFTKDYGRLAAVARGIRKSKSKTASLLQPFNAILISCFGKGELLTLTNVEADQPTNLFLSKNLRCGFYLNELLMKLLAKHDPHPELFTAYTETLNRLKNKMSDDEITLRLFEKNLLMEIGYGFPKKSDKFADEQVYRFDPEQGFLLHPASAAIPPRASFSGKILNALLQEDFEDPKILNEIKYLMRFVFAALLGGKGLQSRRMYEGG